MSKIKAVAVPTSERVAATDDPVPDYDLHDPLQARAALAAKLGMAPQRPMPPAEVAILAAALMREEAARGVPEADRFHLRAYIACPIVVHALALQAANPVNLPDVAHALPDAPPVALAADDAPAIAGLNTAGIPAEPPSTPPMVYLAPAPIPPMEEEEDETTPGPPDADETDAEVRVVVDVHLYDDEAADADEEAVEVVPAAVAGPPRIPLTAQQIELAATRARVYLLTVEPDLHAFGIYCYERLFHGVPAEPVPTDAGAMRLYRDLRAVAAVYPFAPFPPGAHFTGRYDVNTFSFPPLVPTGPQLTQARAYVAGLESDAYQAYARQLVDYFFDTGDHPGYRGSGNKDSRWYTIYQDLRALWEAESGATASHEAVEQWRLVRRQRAAQFRFELARTLRDIEQARGGASRGVQTLVELCQDAYAHASYLVVNPDAARPKKKGRK